MAKIKDGWNYIAFKYAIIDRCGNLKITSNHYFDDNDFKKNFNKKTDYTQYLRIDDTARYFTKY